MANTVKSYVPGLSGAVSSATGASHAETCHAQVGIITTEALTTAAGSTETRTLTNNFIQTGSIVQVGYEPGGGNTKLPVRVYVSAKAEGSATVKIQNDNAAALDGTIKYWFLVI